MTIEDLSARLEKVERANRFMRAFGVLAIVLGVGVAAMGQGASPPKVIKAERFEVWDKDGTRRAVLATDSDGVAMLTLGDKAAKARMTLSVDTNGSPSLSLTDQKGKGRVVLHVLSLLGDPMLTLFDKDGEACAQLGSFGRNAHLTFLGKEGKSHMDLYSEPSGDSGLAFSDVKGSPRAFLGMAESSISLLSLRDAEGKGRLTLLVPPAGGGGLMLTDDEDKPRAKFSVLPSGSSELTLLDKDGKVIERLPR